MGSGTGFLRCIDPDLVKIHPDPQPCSIFIDHSYNKVRTLLLIYKELRWFKFIWWDPEKDPRLLHGVGSGSDFLQGLDPNQAFLACRIRISLQFNAPWL